MRSGKLILLALVFAVLAVGLLAAPASAACTPGTLLCDRFGVELTLQSLPNVGGRAATTAGPYNGYAFNWASMAPTKNTATADWKLGDWYGQWELSNIGFTSTYNRDVPSTNRVEWDYWPSGDEWYDVEALYFDNDAENVYLVIVTSLPPYIYTGGTQFFGVREYRSPFSQASPFWIPPSDIAIDLGKGTARTERYSSTWRYNYGLNLTHENRDVFSSVSGYTSATARDYNLGSDVWKTNTDSTATNQSNDNPAAGLSDWFTAVGTGAAYAHGEHTSFDPLSTRNITGANAMKLVGYATTVRYYEYQFPGGTQENDAPTYIVEAVIPRSLFGADNPKSGDPFSFRYTPTCRDDGNDGEDNANELVSGQDDPVLRLTGDIDDYDWGDAPDSYSTLAASNGPNHAVTAAGPFMGARVDIENDGQPNATATGDDINPASADDEDGVAFVSGLIPGGVATIKIDMTASPAACTLSSWIDFNGNGAFGIGVPPGGEQLSFLTCPTCTGGVGGPNPGLPAGAVHTLTFAVPANATLGRTYARFRCATSGPLPPTGPASNGEVEDYEVGITADGLDYGDAPDTYSTLLSSNGARHIISGPFMGALVDAEADGQPTPGANGDDLNGLGADDEDGVAFIGTPWAAGGLGTISVTMSPQSPACTLSAWVDFNGNGVFDQPAEQLVFQTCPTCVPVVPPATPNPVLPTGGTHTLTFLVPPNAVAGSTYARFRCATQPINSPVGPAPDGEVEDYPVSITNASVDYGDLPNTFATLLASDGARHVLTSNLYLGGCVDAEGDGQPDAQAGMGVAGGDDHGVGTIPGGFPACTAGDDEDGVKLVTPLIPGSQACVSVSAQNTTGSAAVLQGWMDFDGSGTLDASEELVFTGGGAVPGNLTNQQYCFTVPAGATFFGGQTYMRFRLSSAGGLGWTGGAPDGEVEDYWQPLACVGNFVWNDTNRNGIQDEPGSSGINGVGVNLVWYGPDNALGGGDDITYSTTTAQVGTVNGKYLFCGLIPQDGSSNGGTYRFVIPTPPSLYPLATTPSASGSNTRNDSNGNQSGAGTAVSTVSFTIASPIALRTDEDSAGDNPGGNFGFPNTQDDLTYDFGFLADLDFGDLPDTGTGTGPGNYQTLLADSGPRHEIGPALYLGACVDSETNGQPNATATGDDTNVLGAPGVTYGQCSGNDDEDGVTPIGVWTPNASVSLRVTVTGGSGVLGCWIDWNANGNLGSAANKFINGGTLAAGTHNVPVTIPGTYVTGTSLYARCRLFATGAVPGGSLDITDYVGSAVGGEVEDYYWTFTPTAVTLQSLQAGSPSGWLASWLKELVQFLQGRP